MAPAVRVALGEEFGMAPGENTIGKIYAALHMIGFDLAFDTSVSADMTIIEETNELAGILEKGGERKYPGLGPLRGNKISGVNALYLHQQVAHGNVRRGLKGIL